MATVTEVRAGDSVVGFFSMTGSQDTFHGQVTAVARRGGCWQVRVRVESVNLVPTGGSLWLPMCCITERVAQPASDGDVNRDFS